MAKSNEDGYPTGPMQQGAAPSNAPRPMKGRKLVKCRAWRSPDAAKQTRLLLREQFVPNHLWNSVVDDLKGRLDQEDIQVWLEPLRPASSEPDELVLMCPNSTHRRWVRENFAPLLESSLKRMGPGQKLRLEVAPAAAQQPQNPSPSVPALRPPQQMSLPRILDRPPQLNQRYIFDTFVRGQANEFAFAAAQSLAGGSRVFSNTLFLVSSTGLGKSHLTQAVGHQVLDKTPDSRVSYLTAEDFANQMISALHSKKIEAFKDHYRRCCDILLLEEIQFLGGKMKTQDELIFTLDALENAGKRVIFTSTAPPDQIKGLKPNLSSRMAGGVTVAIDPPDHPTRVRILRQYCQAENVHVDGEVLEYLAQQVTDDVRRLHSALVGLIAKGSLTKRPMDLQLAGEVLGQMSHQLSRVSCEQIRDLVAQSHGITTQTISGRSRAKAVTKPRNLAMFLCRRHTEASYAAIGKAFNRDHATVMYGVSKIDRELKTQPKVGQEIAYLEQRLGLGG